MQLQFVWGKRMTGAALRWHGAHMILIRTGNCYMKKDSGFWKQHSKASLEMKSPISGFWHTRYASEAFREEFY